MSYTVQEVDEMRHLTDALWIWERAPRPIKEGKGGIGASFRPEERTLEVEQRAQTYITAGLRPADLRQRYEEMHFAAAFSEPNDREPANHEG